MVARQFSLPGRRTWPALAGLALCAFLLAGCQWEGSGAGAQPAEPVALVASGSIEAREVRVASELGGRVIEVRVSDGDRVQVGDALVILDATPLLLQLAQAEASIATARSDLEVVRAGPRPEEVAALRAALALAEAQRDGALAAWENALATIEEPLELDAQVAQAYAQVQLAEQGQGDDIGQVLGFEQAAQVLRHRKQGAHGQQLALEHAVHTRLVFATARKLGLQ